ncbi:MAG: DUF4340 domain-containing protein [Verrucomicrobiales bacterium]|nr:DUF4340 domain-containing protein [Verrucomicrobiales bacterium]
MGTKTLIRLLIILAIIGGIAAIFHFAGSGGSVAKVTSTTNKTKVFNDFPINDIAEIHLKTTDGELTLQKGEKSWVVAERENYPANAEPIVEMLRKVWDLNIVQPVTIGRSQYGRLNLIAPDEATLPDQAATLVSFKDSEGENLHTLWLGKIYERSENRPDPIGGGMATSEAGRYVKTGSSNSVFLVGETFSDIQTGPSEWIDKSFFKVEDIKSIEIVTGDKKEDWKLTRKDVSSDYVLAKAAKGEELDQAKVSSMKSAFSNAQMEDVFVGAELKENKPEGTTFKISTFDGFNYIISTGEKNDLNELPLSIKVSGKFAEKRKQGEEESDEETARLDKAFNTELKELKDKLAAEKALEGHVFKVRSYLVDSIIKKRSELFVEKEEQSPEQEIAPGVSLPGLPLQGN